MLSAAVAIGRFALLPRPAPAPAARAMVSAVARLLVLPRRCVVLPAPAACTSSEADRPGRGAPGCRRSASLACPVWSSRRSFKARANGDDGMGLGAAAAADVDVRPPVDGPVALDGEAAAPPGTGRRQRILSGVQPTGALHLGNYLGAIKQWVDLQSRYDTYFCVVDLHAITAPHDPSTLASSTRSTAALYLACGIDPDRSTIFVQSHVRAHAELAWLLNCATPLGWLERMTQYKEKARKQGEEVSLGLLAYPVLMAADILLYQADLVPVGEDQKQHLELTRDIAGRVNHMHGGNKWRKKKEPLPSGRRRPSSIFRVPEAFIPPAGARIMSLTNGASKMSKSAEADGSRINLLDSADTIARKVRACKTDAHESVEAAEDRPEATNLLAIYGLATGRSAADVAIECKSLRWGDFKPRLADALVAHLTPIQLRYAEVMAEPEYLDGLLARGADAAAATADATLETVRDAFGFAHPRQDRPQVGFRI